MKKWINMLWVLVLVNVGVQLVSRIVSLPFALLLLVLLPVAFALVHGALRYRWSGILTFIVICLVVSNLLENSSILTGFPFGHYYYTDQLGPKLFLVPLIIGPAYFSTGYLAWVLGTVLVGEVRRQGNWLTTFAVPFIASFLMVAWDLSFDPASSTIGHRWIWQQGGGYFGVPFTNYLGWFFTVYVFFQLFALFLRFRRASNDGEAKVLSRSYYAQVVVMYAAISLAFVLSYVVGGGGNTLVTDAAGVVWHTASITEAEATVSIFTMLFGAALSMVKLLQGPTAVTSTAVEAEAAIKKRTPVIG